MVKKWFIICISILSYILVWCVVGCGAYHMYFHHDKEAAIGMVLALAGLCLCDLFHAIRLKHLSKKEKALDYKER